LTSSTPTCSNTTGAWRRGYGGTTSGAGCDCLCMPIILLNSSCITCTAQYVYLKHQYPLSMSYTPSPPHRPALQTYRPPIFASFFFTSASCKKCNMILLAGWPCWTPMWPLDQSYDIALRRASGQLGRRASTSAIVHSLGQNFVRVIVARRDDGHTVHRRIAIRVPVVEVFWRIRCARQPCLPPATARPTFQLCSCKPIPKGHTAIASARHKCPLAFMELERVHSKNVLRPGDCWRCPILDLVSVAFERIVLPALC